MYQEFWRSFFPDLDDQPGSEQAMVSCPFHSWNVGHEDLHPSLSLYLADGVYNCFSCADVGGPLRSRGDAVTFVETYLDVPSTVALAYRDRVLAGKEPPLPIPDEQIDAWHQALLGATTMLTRVKDERGLTDETIRAARLGWDGERVVIPITNYRGLVVSYRRYTFDKRAKAKFLNPKASGISLGTKRLWPMDTVMGGGPLVLFAGEWDRLLATQLGIGSAVTFTGGEGLLWKPEWNRFVRGRGVWICYDIDKTGVAGASSLARALHDAGAEVRVVQLPITDPPDGDFTDYVVRHGNSVDDFRRLCEAAPVWAPPTPQVDQTVYRPQAEPTRVSLTSSTFDPLYQGQRVVLEAQIAGKAASPYSIIKRATLTCDKMSDDNPACGACPLAVRGVLPLVLDPEKDLLQFIRVTDEQKSAAIRKVAGIPKCPLWEIDVEESQNVEEVLITPRIEQGVVNGLYTDHTLQTGYYFYDTNARYIEDSKSYELTGVRTTDPWKQHVIHIFDTARPVKDSISEFELTEEVREQLRTFRPEAGSGVGDRIAELSRQLTDHVTHVVGRDDLVTALLLGYATVQRFAFLGEYTDGLADVLVIGDTRTGKSESALKLSQHVRLGELVTGEGVSFAGLVGGAQQGASGSWVVTWGRIPLNNGGLVTLDEVSGMPVEQIAQMSGLRSRRVASIIKIRQSETNARTRLIWLSNPRDAKKLREFSYGVEAIPSLIGQPEDVARFDLVVSCASDDVPLDVINQRHVPTGEPRYSADDLRKLILYAWSRKEDQIRFEPDAEEACLEVAREMGRLYSSKIPLIEGANQRIKIAKLAAAAAVLTFSTDPDDESILVVRREHVAWLHAYMDAAYRKLSLDYYGYSAQEKEDEHVAESSRERISNLLRTDSVVRAVAEFMDRADTFRSIDIQDQLAMSDEMTRSVLRTLTDARMIDRKGANLYKTPVFVQILRDMKLERALAEGRA